MRLLRIAIVTGVVLFFVAQLVPYGRSSHDNPPTVAEPAWSSPAVRSLAVASCFDCHSNQTRWPWYSNVAPMSWLVQADVDEGRDTLNFSEWTGGGTRGDLHDALEDRSMPPRKYLLLHPDAKLSATERATLEAELRRIEGDRSGRGGRDRSGRGGRGRG